MNRIIASLKDKRFRYGTFSTAMMLIVVGIFVLVNLVAGQFNITKDMTADQMYSLSSYSKDFLAGLEQDVTIYVLSKTGQENMMMKQLLDEYAATSPHVSVVYRDPSLYPTFVEQYAKTDETVSDNSVIVECGSKFRVVQADDMVTYEINYETYQYEVTSIDIEPQISKAIHYVTLGDSPVIYRVMGDNEYELPANLVKQLELANFEYRDANLMTGEIPEDCDMLVITHPQRDWSPDKAERILKYLQNDGRALFILGYSAERFPNMDGVLSAYGVQLGDYVVFEADTNYYYMLGGPTMNIPQYVANDITQPMIDKKYPSLLYQSTGFNLLSLKKNSTDIEPFLISSNSSFGKVNPNSESVNKEPGDLDGPFNMGVTITDSFYTDVQHTTKMVMLGSLYFLDESLNSIAGGTNWDIVLNSLNWLQEQDSSIYIPSKAPSTVTQLTMTRGQANVLALVAAGILPLLIIGTGLVIWLRRRHS